ncbi:MAG TPA: D-threitol dehydrogenase [Atribacter sp.]|jgi:NAD(P)-dependent dehydrogenase (short-subunit alcohol dehydrogenase family)|uniref:2-dehydro-3-deoxy-D-gluconate 5-dehydrogenase n=1 Tax=Candidatus Atribacter allofermentans TaxID=1852833 RepID=A0A1V5SIM0_9BACT|nr:D-threitol dehydrogenase [Atribacter sp.]MDD3713595.1 D-threitol dehydrogenase [Atribacterota bacterium]OQA54396.1 MAG: 2-dehydro-3-deoxy-D-gluconate 5-dehydrogenase [Candidatus Atribacteria bacterium ADurb.Bin276]HHT10090.1 D-threitol dehydrogenase [Candidatus Atribacteria bacterium]HQK82943.1 D-threitol dehydrogenase [Atribacter sp.]
MDYVPFNGNFSLERKVAVITGAAKGIGKAIALVFAQKGADLVLVDFDKEVDHILKKIEKLERRAVFVQGDITKSDTLQRILDVGLKEFGKIEILINNAGISRLDDAENLSEKDWDDVIAVNLTAQFRLAQIIGRQMIQQRYGKIVNIASKAGLVALPKHAAYTASKAGLIGVTKILALEWAKYNINVNAIAPTVILTEMGEKAWAGEVGEAMKRKIPVDRFGYPEEVAAAALFLACDASNLITGETLVIDGGYTIQ